MTQLFDDKQPTTPALDPGTQRRLAGLDSPPPIPSEFALDGDAQTLTPVVDRGDLVEGEERGTPGERKPLGKLVFVIAVVGGLLGLVLMLTFGVTRTVKQSAQKPGNSPTSESTSAPLVTDDSAALRSQLAFRDQQVKLTQTPPPSPSPEAKDKQEPKPPAQRPARREPAPRVVVRESRAASVAPVPQSQSVQPMILPEPIDPSERWSQLALLGTQGVGEQRLTPTASADIQPVNPLSIPTADDTTTPLQTVLIGRSVTPEYAVPPPPFVAAPDLVAAPSSQEDEPTSEGITPGAQGIIKQQAVGEPTLEDGDAPIELPNNHPVQVASLTPIGTDQPLVVLPGTTVAAQVIVPMTWDLSQARQSETAQGRFMVQLTQDLRTEQGQVALPEGTRLMVQATQVSPSNQLVQAHAIAVMYSAADDRSHIQALPSQALLVVGHDGNPLIAQKLNDLGPVLFQEDLLVGGLSALGRLGEVLNQPSEEFSSAASGETTSTVITRRSRRPDVLSALFDGFGNSVSRRIEQRSQQAIQDQIQQNTIALLPKGTEVLLIVNSDLQVVR